MMRRLWGTSIAVAAALTAALSIGAPAEAYSPGTATAYRPTYNAYTGNWDYHCSFSGWRSGANVTWQCNIRERWLNEYTGFVEDSVRRSNPGSWTPGRPDYSTPTFGYVMQVGQAQMCTEAYATNVDGGVTVYSCI
jgi:hypothetical protein